MGNHAHTNTWPAARPAPASAWRSRPWPGGSQRWPATMVRSQSRLGRKGLAIGIDIGGTKVAAGVVDAGRADPQPGEALHPGQ